MTDELAGQPVLGRTVTTSATLARLGFVDVDRAARLLADLGLAPTGILASALTETADPDLALTSLARLAEVAVDRTLLLDVLHTDQGLRARLLAVLGASAALGDHLARHPGDWQVLTSSENTATRPSLLGLQQSLLAAVGADDPDGKASAPDGETLDALRVAYRRHLLGLAARDLTAGLGVDEVAGELADLATATLRAALTIARASLPAGAAEPRLAVIGMGKCGGRELNYVSDVDVVFVAEPADETAAQLASGLMRVCSQPTAEGAIWPVDAALRPEGRSGPLVRTLASHQAYYQRWARTWEFQALLKARPVAGDTELGRAYVESLAPLVWRAAGRDGFVDDVRAMRRRVEEQLPKAAADRELKLGPGGLRDVEFAVQLLQLVHGRSDPSVRSPNTLRALDALAAGGYVGRDDARTLDTAYRFLRATEHRLQLQRLRRTHTIPDDDVELRWLARAMGYRSDAVRAFNRDRERHAREVRRRHEKLFYRPLLGAVARLPAEEARLSPEAARQRLEALGFADPTAALRHIEALTAGVSRRASIQQTLLPVMLGWFADAADPDGGLLAFRQVSEALGSTPWYLRLLRDEGATAERLARLLATSRYVADLLVRAPDGVALLAQDGRLQPRPREHIQAEVLATVERNADDWEAAVAGARGLRRRELLRVAAADLLGLADLETVGAALTDVAAATIEAALATATAKVSAEQRADLRVRLAIVGMGRLGGREQGYGSDADVLFVYDGPDEPATTRAAHDIAEELRRLLALPGPDPALVVDADLRPEGRQGPLVRSLASYAEYYRRWAREWEMQALLRAVPIAGDADLGERFVSLIDPLRYPDGGLTRVQLREIRRIKARMEAERLPRGTDPARHLKLGPGGLADIEWVVQLLQLQHAHAVASLRTSSSLAALSAARAEGFVDAEDAATLETAWRLASRVRNALMLVRGRPAEEVPTDLRALAATSRAIGYLPGQVTDFVEEHRRVSRRARAVVERLFYG